MWLKNEINIIRNKRRRSNSPGYHPILYNPGMFQNHPVMCWQLVQMSGMRVTEHLCPSKLDGWAHKQPALYFIYLHSDKPIFPVFIIFLFCYEFNVIYYVLSFPYGTHACKYPPSWTLIFYLTNKETEVQRLWVTCSMYGEIKIRAKFQKLVFLPPKLCSFHNNFSSKK